LKLHFQRFIETIKWFIFRKLKPVSFTFMPRKFIFSFFIFFSIALTGIGLHAQVYLQENFDGVFTGNPAAPNGWKQSRIQIFGDEKPVPTGTIGAKDWTQNQYLNSNWTYKNCIGWDPISSPNNGVLWLEDAFFGPNANSMARRMESPAINLSSATSPFLIFNYFNSLAADTLFPLIVVFSTDNGLTWKPLMHVQGNTAEKTSSNSTSATLNQQSAWSKIYLPIPSNLKLQQVKFGFQKNASYNLNANIFIDSLSVEEYIPSTITSKKSGLWSDPSTWGGTIPNSKNNVSIAAGHTVEIDVNIARAQQVSIAGTLRFYASSSAQVLQCFADMLIQPNAIYSTNTSSNSSIARSSYIGGNLVINGTYLSNSNTANALYLSGASLRSISGTGQFSNNGIARLYIQNAEGIKIDMPFSVNYALYLIEGNLNPNAKLSIGNSLLPNNTTIIKNGRSNLTQRAVLPNIGAYSRSIFYGGTVNGNMPSALIGNDTIYSGLECDSLNATDAIIPGNLSINTSGIVKLNSNLKVGNASIGGSLSLMRGIILTSTSKILTIGPLGNGHIGVEPSKSLPYTTQGSYILGPIKFERPSNNASIIYVPIGLGADGLYSTTFQNQLKTIQLNPGTNWNAQTITFSCITQTISSIDTGLTALASKNAYYLNLNGGNDLSNLATIGIRGINSSSIYSDLLFGLNSQVFVGQSTAISGATWRRKSNAFTGTANSFEQNQQYTFYSSNTGTYSPIGPLSGKGNYFTLVTNASLGSISSSQVIKNTDTIAANTKGTILCKVLLNISGQIPLQLNQCNFSFNGTNRLSNLQNIKVLLGGTDSNFYNAKQYGNTLNTASSSNSIVGNTLLKNGLNYIWIVADIQSGAVLGDSISIQINSMNFSTLNYSNFINPTAFKKIGTAFTFSSLLAPEKKTSVVAQNSFENNLLRIGLKMGSNGATSSLNKIVFETNNKQVKGWQKIKQLSLYYTGKQNTFSNANKLASVFYPDSIFEIVVPIQLNKDSNFFWLSADIEKYAATDDSFYISCKSVDINNSSFSFANNINYFKIKIGYPVSAALSNTDEDIWGVSIGTLNNQSNCSSSVSSNSSANRYADYTSIPATNLTKGNVYNLSLYLGSCAANNLSNAAVFIDYNQNNSFEDDGELVYATGVHNSNNLGISFTGSIQIPIYAVAGLTRMRIVYAEQSGIPSSKGFYNNGETEDYTLNIVDLPFQTYIWNGNTSKNYQIPSNWTPNRISPNFNDKLVFNTGKISIDSVKSETVRCVELKDSCVLKILNKTNQNLIVFDSLILRQNAFISSNENLCFQIGFDTIQTGQYIGNNLGIYGLVKRWFNKYKNNVLFPVTDSNATPHFVNIQLAENPNKYGAITCNFAQKNIGSNGIPFQSEAIAINSIYQKGIWTINSSNLATGTLFNCALSVKGLEGIYNVQNLGITFRGNSNSYWGQNGMNGSENTQLNGTTQVGNFGNNQFGEFTIGTDSNSNNFNNKVYISINCLLQGLYKGDGLMNSVLNACAGNSFTKYTDTVFINLRDPENQMNLIGSFKIVIDTLGYGLSEIPSTFLGKFYYWEIKHRNSVATWTAEPVLIAGANTYYDFTYGDYTAFGNNLFDNGDGYFLIYGGDVNQDGFVDGNDFIDVDNDNAQFYSGYKETDINGDGFVDGNDFILIDNNNALFIGTIQP
jgi:hypothetical protein